jgi:hypothetical protein
VSEISRIRNGIVRVQCESRYIVYTMEVGRMAWGNGVPTIMSTCSIGIDEIWIASFEKRVEVIV